MIKFNIIVAILLLLAGSSMAQSIRKNYNEMTQTEKDAFVDALYALRNGPDLIDNLAVFHNDYHSNIHSNSIGLLTDDIFLAWHRRQIFELEQAMQDINANLSIPFWDWTTDNSPNDPLWDHEFLGQFDVAWSLGRDLGSGTLPSITDVNDVQAIPDFSTYTSNLESGIVHTGAHDWVAHDSSLIGLMSGGASPRDPSFYLHHGMIDKLWQDWEEAHGTSSFQSTDMPRYNGIYNFDGQILPLVNPNDITDSKALGVFFAENGLAELENYTVSNTYRNQEVFYYQYTIKTKDNFIIPSGNNCKMESVNEIRLEPGFHAQNGAVFVAKIDTDNDIVTSQRGAPIIVRNTKPFSDINIVENAYIHKDEVHWNMIDVTVHPNPFAHAAIFTYEVRQPDSPVLLQVYNSTGKTVATLVNAEKMAAGTYQVQFDGSGLASGVHLYRLQIGDIVKTGKVILKHR